MALQIYRAMLRVGGHPSITTFSILLTAANDAGLMSELHLVSFWQQVLIIILILYSQRTFKTQDMTVKSLLQTAACNVNSDF